MNPTDEICRKSVADGGCPGEVCWQAFLNGQLSAAEVARLDAHLRDCGACQQLIDAISCRWTLDGRLFEGRRYLERTAEQDDQAEAVSGRADEEIREMARRLAANPPASTVGSGAGRAAIPSEIPRIPGIEELTAVARGGMGVVYRGRDVTLGRTVAVKVLRSGGVLSDSARERARRESLLCARIEHPNIVTVHAAGEADGMPYLVMNWIVGPSLQKRIDEEGRLPAREAATIVRDIARGLERVHAYGIIHRDLKPDNVLLSTKTEPPTPILIDFGLARTEDSAQQLTQAMTVLGTPGFMAPEQTGLDTTLGEVSAATDVHGLGAMLYALLTGKPPYAAATATATMQMATRGELSDPAALGRDVPADLQTIVLKCLQPSPARRYRSAGEMADDLERFLDGRPVVARPISTPERLVKWARRRPVTATLSGLAGAMLLLTAAGAAYHVAELERANTEITASRDLADEAVALAERSMERLTGASIQRMLMRGEPLDEGDQAYLRQVVEEFERWPLGSDPVGALEFRAQGFRRVGDLFYGVGQYEDSLACRQRELATLTSIEDLQPGSVATLRARLTALYMQRYCLYHLSRPAEAIESSRESVALLEAAPADFPRRESDLIDTKLHLGIFLQEQQQVEEGHRLVEESLQQLTALREERPEDVSLAVQEVNSLYDAQLYDFNTGRTEARREKIDRLVSVASAALEQFDEQGETFAVSLSNGLSQQANLAREAGQIDDAVVLAQRRRDVCFTFIKESQPMSRVHREAVDADLSLAKLYRELDDSERAVGALDEAMAIAEQLVAAEPAVFDHAVLLGRAMYDRGVLFLAEGNMSAAVENLQRATAVLKPWLDQQGRVNDATMLVTSAQQLISDLGGSTAAAANVATE
jgi:tetratricopeptide (TPR) repeat protein/predicted Ser/Thr protein kinase